MEARYDEYVSTYSNCTYVDGNLEIVLLQDQDIADRPPYNLDFMLGIQEVTGYVIVSANFVESLGLDNLRIIRGQTLYSDEDGRGYSLYVTLNYKEDSSTAIGLKELRLKSLTGKFEVTSIVELVLERAADVKVIPLIIYFIYSLNSVSNAKVTGIVCTYGCKFSNVRKVSSIRANLCYSNFFSRWTRKAGSAINT